MLRFICCLLCCLTASIVSAQLPVEETSTNFINFHLNGISQVRAYWPQYHGEGTVASLKEFQYDSLDIDLAGRHLPHPISSNTRSNHATLMATILAGGGNTFLNGWGVAWKAQITSSSFLEIFPDPNDYFLDLGIRVQNHSYGLEESEYAYDPVAAAYDLQSSQLPELLHVFSIGNAGHSSPDSGPYAGLEGFANLTGDFKTAKNILTVGVVDSFGIIDPRSSRGPTFDGRLKPEVVAFGIDGASAAAALTSGTALLLQQAYREKYGSWPAAALVKGLLVNTARDLGPAGPDYTYGFGNVDIYRALQVLRAGQFRQDTLGEEEERRWVITVPEQVARLRITLAWNDPPASVYAEQALINDLDLEVLRRSDGQLSLPLVLSDFPHVDSLSAAARPGRDRRNNLEHIVLDRPAAGAYEIVVRAHELGVAEQAFQVVYAWDTLTNFSWRYPAADNFVVPDDRFANIVYWDSDLTDTNGQLEYRALGGAWQTVATDVNLATKAMHWYPPDTVARAQLRMQVDGQFYLTDTFTVAPPPRLRFHFDCPDSLGISWSQQPGIDTYRLYRLQERYMQAWITTQDTFLVLSKQDLRQPYIALAPVLPDGHQGVRSFAYRTDQQGAQCYVQTLFGEIIGEEAKLYLEVGTTYGIAGLELQRWINGRYQARQTLMPGLTTQYTFTDTDLAQGINRYRIRVILLDGGEVFSEPVDLEYIQPGGFLIYPNPVSRQGSFQVLHNLPQPELVTFQLYTVHGQLVVELPLFDVENELFPAALQSGMYVYRVLEEGRKIKSGKLIVR